MEHQKHVCYEVKLNRLFNIQQKKELVLVAIIAAATTAYVTINLIRDSLDWGYLLFVLATMALILLVELFSHPRCLDVTPESIRFQRQGALLHLLKHGRIFGGIEYGESVTLYNIQSIEYLQTPLEKLFSCGHIRICGDANSNSLTRPASSYTVYGVKDFENTSAWMKEYINLSLHTQE